MNRKLMVMVATLGGWTCVAGAAEGEPRNSLAKATQEEANSYFGLSEQELTTAIGYPFEITFPAGAAGTAFKFFTYISESIYQTTFTISTEKGSVIGGLVKGTMIRNPNWKPPTSEAGGQSVGGTKSR